MISIDWLSQTLLLLVKKSETNQNGLERKGLNLFSATRIYVSILSMRFLNHSLLIILLVHLYQVVAGNIYTAKHSIHVISKGNSTQNFTISYYTALSLKSNKKKRIIAHHTGQRITYRVNLLTVFSLCPVFEVSIPKTTLHEAACAINIIQYSELKWTFRLYPNHVHPSWVTTAG